MATTTTWSWGWTIDDQGEDDEYGDSYKDLSSPKDTLIMLVDCSVAMFNAVDDESPFQLSMKCIRSVLLNKIISSDKDVVGVVFFGTDKRKNPNEFDHIYVFQDLDLPDADRIKQVEDTLQHTQGFADKYGHSDGYSFSDVLWTCSSMLANSPNRNSHKRILLFTNNDDPNSSSPAQQRQAKTRVKDLLENGVEMELMHIGSTFDVSKFYQDVLFCGDDGVSLPDPSERFEELLMRVRSKEYKKRALQKVPLILAPGIDVGVGVYSLVRESKRPAFVRLDKRTNEELKTQTKMLCDDTGTELMSSDIKYFQDFGGEKAVFEKEETAGMKRISDQGFRLIGFKPYDKMKQYLFIKPGRFIYPDENDISGSSKAFSAFMDRCIAKLVVPICCYVATANTAPRFVALFPQKEELGDGNVQVTPPGFHVIYLPFAEDIRKIHYERASKATTEQIDKAKEVIKKLSFEFQSESFENPALQKHFHHLEAVALERESVEDVADFTQPDVDRIERRVGTLLDEFSHVVFSSGHVDPSKRQKRKNTEDSSTSEAKRLKTSTEVETAARVGNLDRLRVPELKDYLKSIGVKASGRKQDLIEQVKNHLGV